MTKMAAAKWLDGWPERSPWRLYFTEDPERWALKGVCPECRELVSFGESDWAKVAIGTLKFMFHGACHDSFQYQAAAHRIDWAEPANSTQA